MIYDVHIPVYIGVDGLHLRRLKDVAVWQKQHRFRKIPSPEGTFSLWTQYIKMYTIRRLGIMKRTDHEISSQ
jgi:hypothetical protein